LFFSLSSKDIVPLKSEEISSGVLLSVTIYSIPALIAASTRNGAFSRVQDLRQERERDIRIEMKESQ
jgi:hypothetical protein